MNVCAEFVSVRCMTTDGVFRMVPLNSNNTRCRMSVRTWQWPIVGRCLRSSRGSPACNPTSSVHSGVIMINIDADVSLYRRIT